MKKNSLVQKGFTLVETLVAIAIMSILVLSVVNMIVAMSGQEKRSRAVAEVDSAASGIMEEITQGIRNANGIISPATSTNSTSSLSVRGMVVGENPTTFTLSANTLTLTKGTSTPYRIANRNVTVTSVLFQNITATSTKGSVRITVNVSYNNTANDPTLNYSSRLITTVTIR